MVDRAADHGVDSRAVSALMRRVAAEVVMPHFRRLSADQIAYKAADDLVTVADREAELWLADGLRAIEPGARVIGEEAFAADKTLLDGIGDGLAWIVDPIDGTNNYAHGRSPFGLMIALVADGVTQAGWIFDPVADRLCHAALGGGAFIDGERVSARASGAARPIAALSYYVPAERQAVIRARTADRWTPADIPRCAAEQYARLVLGENDIALFHSVWPWDHAPGALFLTEAGGRVGRLDGAAYRVADRSTGLLAAATPALWDEAAALLG